MESDKCYVSISISIMMLGKRGMQAGVCKTCAFPSSTTTLSRVRSNDIVTQLFRCPIR